jgi:hypothetical protein
MNDYEEDDHEGLPFSDDFENIPANGPETHAHVIDGSVNEEVNYGKVTIWDTVGTMLYKISPETLQRFLNPQYNSFKLLNNRSARMSLLIWRKGAGVLVSSP